MATQMVNNGAFTEEKAELERILASDSFARAHSDKLILQHVCQACFEGREESLKEYNIAVEALGRPDNFDHRRNAIVRVEFHKIRKRLKEYYATEGRSSELLLTIPRGQYAPQFIRRAEGASRGAYPPTDDDAPQGSGFGLRRWYWLGLIAAALAVAYFMTARPLEEHPASSGLAETAVAVHRISLGTTQVPYVDEAGVTWLGEDGFITGGEAVVDETSAVDRVPNREIYRSRREGPFALEFPLEPGFYEVHLHFAETVLGAGNSADGLTIQGSSSRVFHVDINGQRVLKELDVLADARGPNKPLEKVFAGVVPTDEGVVRIDFVPYSGQPILNAVELFRTADARPMPIRILAGRTVSLVDSHNHEWGPDRYVDGGTIVPRQAAVSGVDAPNIFAAERYGNFSYRIPVDPNGSYTLRLLFAETWWGESNPGGGGIGSRVFDVLCNGVKILDSFDVFAEAGGENQALVKTFRGIVPNPQDMIELDFVRIENYASINAIEILPE